MIDSHHFQPVAVRCHHAPRQQIVQRRSPKHRFFATGIHRDIAANTGRIRRRRITGKYQTGIICHIHNAPSHYTRTGINGCVSLFDTRQTGRPFQRIYSDQFFGVNHCGIKRQRHRTTGITGTATTRNNGQSQLDTITHQMTDFCFATRIQHHKRIFNPPVGGIGDMRNTGKTVKTDIVFTGMFGQQSQRLTPHFPRVFKVRFKGINRLMCGFNQLCDPQRSIRMFTFILCIAFLHLLKTMP